MLVSIRNLTFGWQKDALFENLSCDLAEGEIIQLKGENGAGKTTLLQLIAGMMPHFNRGEKLQGEILINDQPVFEKSPKHFFPITAFIPSINLDFFLFTETLNQEILISSAISKIELNDADQRLEEFSHFFSIIKSIINQPFKTMPIHQKILSLTFIFYLQNARLFLFDEVMNTFSDQDTEHWHDFFNWLKSKRCSIVFVSHHLPNNTYPVWLLAEKRLARL